VIALTGSLFSNRALSADGDSLFATYKVHEINIRFSQPNYWDSLLFYYYQGLEHYMSATVIANGRVFENAGVRLKGNSSFTHPNNKKSFRISFDEFVSGQKWDGMKGVHLNNFWNDPSFLREKLHLDFCKTNNIAAPRGNFVRLSINDTVFAFYSLIEHVDKTFLTSRFGSSSGDYFKAVDAIGTISDYYSDFRWLGADSSLYYNHYELKSNLTNGPWKKLLTFIDTLNHSSDIAASLKVQLNTETYYKAMATDIVMGNLDSYVYSSRNFYVYFKPPTNKVDWIVWDASLSFGGLPGGPTDIESLPVTYVSSDTGRPLFARIVNNPTLKQEYLLSMCRVYNSNFTTSALYPKIDSIVSLIRPYVYEDQRKMFTNQQFETNVISDITVSGRRIPGIKSFITLRRSSIQSQLNALGIDCSNGIEQNGQEIAGSFVLYQNYPNPFNPSTKIEYALSRQANVSLVIFDALGKRVVTLVNDQMQNSGSYSLEWNGTDAEGNTVPAGMYFMTLSDGTVSVTKKLALIK
jgi:spore coat protein CotH